MATSKVGDEPPSLILTDSCSRGVSCEAFSCSSLLLSRRSCFAATRAAVASCLSESDVVRYKPSEPTESPQGLTVSTGDRAGRRRRQQSERRRLLLLPQCRPSCSRV